MGSRAILQPYNGPHAPVLPTFAALAPNQSPTAPFQASLSHMETKTPGSIAQAFVVKSTEPQVTFEIPLLTWPLWYQQRLLATELGPGSHPPGASAEVLPVSFPRNTLRHPLSANSRFPSELPRTTPTYRSRFPFRTQEGLINPSRLCNNIIAQRAKDVKCLFKAPRSSPYDWRPA
jgi:hypothetical protein